MQPQRLARGVVIALGAILTVVLAAGALRWRQLLVGHHLRRLERDPEAFPAALSGSPSPELLEALRRFTATPRGAGRLGSALLGVYESVANAAPFLAEKEFLLIWIDSTTPAAREPQAVWFHFEGGGALLGEGSTAASFLRPRLELLTALRILPAQNAARFPLPGRPDLQGSFVAPEAARDRMGGWDLEGMLQERERLPSAVLLVEPAEGGGPPAVSQQ